MIDTPKIVDTEAALTAVIHLEIPRDQMQTHFGPAMEELLSVLASQQIEPRGPAFAYYFSMPPGRFDCEIGFIVAATVAASGRVKASQLPATKVARTTYTGPYEGLYDAWGQFNAWMDSQSIKRAEELWEHYVVGPQSTTNPEEYETELNRLLAE
jgi:effector-binding domain-containing protein